MHGKSKCHQTYIGFRVPDEKVTINAALPQDVITIRSRNLAVIPRRTLDLFMVGGQGARVGPSGGSPVAAVMVAGRSAVGGDIVGEVLTELDQVVFGHETHLSLSIPGFEPIRITDGPINDLQPISFAVMKGQSLGSIPISS